MRIIAFFSYARTGEISRKGVSKESMNNKKKQAPGRTEPELSVILYRKVFRCKLCDSKFYSPIWETCAADTKAIARGQRISPVMHECKEGSVGVAELVGIEEVSKRPINTKLISGG